MNNVNFKKLKKVGKNTLPGISSIKFDKKQL